MNDPAPPSEQSPQKNGAETAQMRHATAVVVGAGDYIGSAIAKRFAAEGYVVVAGRRNGEKLAPLAAAIEASGGRCVTQSLDARQEAEVAAFMARADAIAPLEVCVFNVGGNVAFPLLDTTERVFRKVWEMACFAGFLAGREAARVMLPHGRGSIFFTGATASLRGGSGYAAFAAAKAGLRATAQAMARELGPQNIHVAHLVIDAGVDTAWVRERIAGQRGADTARLIEPDRLMQPRSIADAYWNLHQQTRDAWTFEADLRPFAEHW